MVWCHGNAGLSSLARTECVWMAHTGALETADAAKQVYDAGYRSTRARKRHAHIQQVPRAVTLITDESHEAGNRVFK